MLGESKARLLIPAFDAVSGICHTFRTPHHPLLGADSMTTRRKSRWRRPPHLHIFRPPRFATWSLMRPISTAECKLPALAAIIEAVCYLEVPLDRIDVLSIGTTEEPFTVKSMAQSGVVGWGKTLLSLLMSAQVNSVVDHAQKLVTEARFLRVNTMTSPGMYALDKASEIEISSPRQQAGERSVRSLSGEVEVFEWRFCDGLEGIGTRRLSKPGCHARECLHTREGVRACP